MFYFVCKNVNGINQVELHIAQGVPRSNKVSIYKQIIEMFSLSPVPDRFKIKRLMANFEPADLVWAFADCCDKLGRVSGVYSRSGSNIENSTDSSEGTDFTPFLVISFAPSIYSAASI